MEEASGGAVPGRRERQQISVPFCWEDVPGRPKREWRVNSPPALLPPARRNYNPFVDDGEEDDFLGLNAEAPSSSSAESSETIEIASEENSGDWAAWQWDSGEEEDVGGGGGGAEDVSILEFLFPLSSPEVSFLHEMCFNEGLNPGNAARRRGFIRKKVQLCGLFGTGVNRRITQDVRYG
ncbi:unnamed protein product [Spirodela intermedia]|uniref:Uncharacterized protein n=1 Tax=Spirodela intermedia TaxID=51605 RepID=A0A7I8IHD3_SPIIN|nr:unnamed protein product [Spirodela intermedia]CAA6656262.1 unnamed protein product [Spirodela intermedia]